jgi:hypothetical protein
MRDLLGAGDEPLLGGDDLAALRVEPVEVGAAGVFEDLPGVRQALPQGVARRLVDSGAGLLRLPPPFEQIHEFGARVTPVDRRVHGVGDLFGAGDDRLLLGQRGRPDLLAFGLVFGAAFVDPRVEAGGSRPQGLDVSDRGGLDELFFEGLQSGSGFVRAHRLDAGGDEVELRSEVEVAANVDRQGVFLGTACGVLPDYPFAVARANPDVSLLVHAAPGGGLRSGCVVERCGRAGEGGGAGFGDRTGDGFGGGGCGGLRH